MIMITRSSERILNPSRYTALSIVKAYSNIHIYEIHRNALGKELSYTSIPINFKKNYILITSI